MPRGFTATFGGLGDWSRGHIRRLDREDPAREPLHQEDVDGGHRSPGTRTTWAAPASGYKVLVGRSARRDQGLRRGQQDRHRHRPADGNQRAHERAHLDHLHLSARVPARAGRQRAHGRPLGRRAEVRRLGRHHRRGEVGEAGVSGHRGRQGRDPRRVASVGQRDLPHDQLDLPADGAGDAGGRHRPGRREPGPHGHPHQLQLQPLGRRRGRGVRLQEAEGHRGQGHRARSGSPGTRPSGRSSTGT